MSLPDTIFIFGLALVIFGPRKLPEIGRQMGKLLYEFRRASNEFKAQIEEELRAADEAERSNRAVIESSLSDPAIPSSTGDSPNELPEQSAESTADMDHSDTTDLTDSDSSAEGEAVDSEEDWEWDNHKNYGDADSAPESFTSEAESVDGESALAESRNDGSWSQDQDQDQDQRDGWDDYRVESDEGSNAVAGEAWRDDAEQPFQWEEAIEPEPPARLKDIGEQPQTTETEDQAVEARENHELNDETGTTLDERVPDMREPDSHDVEAPGLETIEHATLNPALLDGKAVDPPAFPALEQRVMSTADFAQQEAEAANHHA